MSKHVTITLTEAQYQHLAAWAAWEESYESTVEEAILALVVAELRGVTCSKCGVISEGPDEQPHAQDCEWALMRGGR